MKKPTFILNDSCTLENFISVVKGNSKIEFHNSYLERVNKSRKIIEDFVKNGEIIYGVTTGFGSNSTKVISADDAKKLQENILLSHATSLGEPLSEECVRAVMLMILLNGGQGHSGVRIETLERIAYFLNNDLYPFAPGNGSVGYLAPEAHIALALIGKGYFIEDGKKIDSDTVFRKKGLDYYGLSYKEGLFLVSGTTSVTGIGAVALDSIINTVLSADIISSMTLEVSKATLKAFSEPVMSVRKQPYQAKTAENVRNILSDSEISQEYMNYRLQDALSLRCIPQLHGAVKNRLYGAKVIIENEFKSCCDNPITWNESNKSSVLSCGNPDSSYVGLEMDTVAIAATMAAKMSERRTNRMIDGSLSEKPAFLVSDPGLNSGLMITQYTQAGLLGEMKILSTPSVTDNIPTCANQEDYVAMGYNASRKALSISEKLTQILAIELLAAYQSYYFMPNGLKKSKVTGAIFDLLSESIPKLDEDNYLYPYIEKIIELINSGELIKITEDIIGKIE